GKEAGRAGAGAGGAGARGGAQGGGGRGGRQEARGSRDRAVARRRLGPGRAGAQAQVARAGECRAGRQGDLKAIKTRFSLTGKKPFRRTPDDVGLGADEHRRTGGDAVFSRSARRDLRAGGRRAPWRSTFRSPAGRSTSSSSARWGSRSASFPACSASAAAS